MRWNLIQTKALAALFVCLIVGVVGIVALMNYSFATNSAALAAESVSSAERLFGILTAREVSKMTVVSEALIADPAKSLSFLNHVVAIRDDPVARDQLGRDLAGVPDGQGVGERKLAAVRIRLFREILRLDGYAEFILAHRFSNSKFAARVRTPDPLKDRGPARVARICVNVR